MAWKGPQAASSQTPAATRQIDGPTEQRMQAQDEKLASLQADVQKMRAVVETHQTEVAGQIATLESNTKTSFEQMNTQLIGMR